MGSECVLNAYWMGSVGMIEMNFIEVIHVRKIISCWLINTTLYYSNYILKQNGNKLYYYSTHNE